MSILDAIILGLIQGLTEFLPISSSGHLVLSKHLLGAAMPGVLFELIVHFGTLMSVVIYFRGRIYRLILSPFRKEDRYGRRTILQLIIGTIPAVIVALAFKDEIESAFASPLTTSILLLVTGIILFTTAWPLKFEKEIKIPHALAIGIGQALAIFPGISRSGSSITAGLLAGVKPVRAAEFSFLLSIPAIAGAIIFKINDIAALNTSLLPQYIIGAVISFLSGLLAVYLLLDLIKKGKFGYFGIYCSVIGFIGIIVFG